MKTLIKNNKRLSILALSIAIVLLAFGAYQSMAKEISISIDGETTSVRTTKKTVGDLLTAEEIDIDKEDYINIALEESLVKDMEIVIRRAIPVSIEYDNRILEVKTASKTVKELLETLEIEYTEDDTITPSLEEKLVANIDISIVRVEEKTQVLNEEIPFITVTKDNKELEKGKTNRVQVGKPGMKEVVIKEIYENGILKSTEIVEERIIKDPTPQIVEKGTKDFFMSSRGATTYKRSVVMTATAYDLSFESTGKRPGDKYYGITASGTQARPGVVAVDPSVIPLGTKLYIESMDGTKDYGFAVAEDTGGAIKGNKIDLFMENSSDVRRFGRRKVRVYILD